MNVLSVGILLLVLLAGFCPHVIAQATDSQELFRRIFAPDQIKDNPAAETNALRRELMAVYKTVTTKLRSTNSYAKLDLASELDQLDAIYERFKAEKTEDLAAVLKMKADLYFQILHKPELGIAAMRKLVAELPETELAKESLPDLEYLLPFFKGRELRDSLKLGEPFPDFAEKDMNGQPLSLSALKGKVVMLDFWSIKTGHFNGIELPSVLARYQKYHDQGFEIIGINMDTNEASVRAYIKTNGMVWPQFFDGEGYNNKLAIKYGIYIASDDFLIDANGNYAGGGFYPALYDKKVEEALARKNWPR